MSNFHKASRNFPLICNASNLAGIELQTMGPYSKLKTDCLLKTDNNVMKARVGQGQGASGQVSKEGEIGTSIRVPTIFKNLIICVLPKFIC